jgi:hypothetical protein
MADDDHRSEHERILDLEETLQALSELDADNQAPAFAPAGIIPIAPIYFAISGPITGTIASANVSGKCSGEDVGAATLDMPSSPGLYQLTVSVKKGGCTVKAEGIGRDVHADGGQSRSWTFDKNAAKERIGLRCSGEGENCGFSYSFARLGTGASQPADDKITGTVCEGSVDGTCGSKLAASIQVPNINGGYMLTLTVDGDSCPATAKANPRGMTPLSVRAGSSHSRTFTKRGTRGMLINIECSGSSSDACKFSWKLTRLANI